MLSTMVSCLPGVANTAELCSRGLRSIGRRFYGSGQKSGALVLIWSLWRNFEAAAFKSVPKVRWVAVCRSTDPKNSPLRHVRSAAWRPSPLRPPYQMLATGGSPLSKAAESRVSGGKLLAAAGAQPAPPACPLADVPVACNSEAMPRVEPSPQPIVRTSFVMASVGFGVVSLYLAGLAAFGLSARAGPAKLIVVLGNAVDLDGRPSPRLAARLDAALAAWRSGLAPRLLVSGGMAPGGRDEAAAMARYLVAKGVPPEAILQDPRGRDTFETARHAAAVLGGHGRVLVATQWFHVPRTVLAMRRFGLGPVSATWPRFAEARDIYSFLREAAGLPYYAIRPVGAYRAGHELSPAGATPAADSRRPQPAPRA